MSFFNKLLSISLISISVLISGIFIANAWTPPSHNPPYTGGAINYYNGNIGIGTTSPGAKLDVQSGQTTAGIRLLSGGADLYTAYTLGRTTAEMYLGVADSSGAFITGSVAGDIVFRSDGGKLHFGTGSETNVMTLSSGNVGIGTIDPGSYKLKVQGDANVTGTLTAGGFSGPVSGTLSAGNVSSGDFGSNTGGGNYSFPANVGIGTTAPGALLHGYKSSGSIIAKMETLTANTASYEMKNSIADWYVQNLSDGNFRIYEDSGANVIIEPTGNVGIGTTSPLAQLHIHRAADDPYIGFSSGTSGEAWMTQIIDGEWRTGTQNDAFTGFNELMRIDRSGNVGIGTPSPATKLHVSGAGQQEIRVSDTTNSIDVSLIAGTGQGFVGTETSHDFRIITGGSSQVTVDTDGNVGIGTTSPSYKLQVAGTIYSSSGGFRFPDGTTQTTAYAGGSQTITAANVSSGDFGANTGGGNYSFPANVGIGTTSPTSRLHVVAADDSHITVGNTAGTVGFFGDGGSGSDGQLVLYNSAGGSITVALNGNGNSYINGGNVGIGTTAPGQALTLGTNKNIRLDWGGGTDTNIEMYYDADYRQGINFEGNNRRMTLYNYRADGSDTELSLYNGNVGIGTTDPGSYKLKVQGDANVTGTLTAGAISGPLSGTVSAANVSAGEFGSNTGGGNYTFPSIVYAGTGFRVVDNSHTIMDSNQFYCNNASNCHFNYSGTGLTAVGNSTGGVSLYGQVTIGGNWSLGGSAQTNLAMNSKNITGVNKLTAVTIDPLYDIGGEKYSTYVPSISGGVKEETTGVVRLAAQNNESGIMNYVIDFANAERGSDLWLFYQVTDFGKNWENLVALLTPNFNGKVWYEKKPDEKKLIIYGQPVSININKYLEVSYRFTANRFDWQNWPNLAIDQSEEAGFSIENK